MTATINYIKKREARAAAEAARVATAIIDTAQKSAALDAAEKAQEIKWFGFGACGQIGAQVCRVVIPVEDGAVQVINDGEHFRIVYAEIDKAAWLEIEEICADEFNKRLKFKGLEVSKFGPGVNFIDGMLAKELAALFDIAADSGSTMQRVFEIWSGLQPEHRWNYFSAHCTPLEAIYK